MIILCFHSPTVWHKIFCGLMFFLYFAGTIVVRTDWFFLLAIIFCQNQKVPGMDNIFRASDISRKKKQNFAGFSGANSRKNRPISRDFRGKKVKIRSKVSRFRGKKVKIHRKIARFRGKFRGENSPRNNQ